MKLFSHVVLAFFLIGCSYSPREVSAYHPLVADVVTEDYQSIPVKYWTNLANPKVTTINIQQGNIILKDLFTSALGQTCRQLTVNDLVEGTQSNRIACQEQRASSQDQNSLSWHLMPSIVTSPEVQF